ncbi:MAG: hypothetical protein ACKV2T_28955 [Kofleriaceae bacterium]
MSVSVSTMPAVVADPGGALAMRAEVRTLAGARPWATALGLGVRTSVGGWVGGVDLHVGGGAEGMVWGVRASPIGLGIARPRYSLGLLAHAGSHGVGGVDAFALAAGAELFAEVEIGERIRLGVIAQTSWLASTPARQARIGASLDEVCSGLGARLGRRFDEYNGAAARGWRLAVTGCRDASGDTLHVAIGYAIDVAWLPSPTAFPTR